MGGKIDLIMDEIQFNPLLVYNYGAYDSELSLWKFDRRPLTHLFPMRLFSIP